MRVVIVSSVFPNRSMPVLGTFCLERARLLAKLASVRVVAPVPFFPRTRWLRSFKTWHAWARVPTVERIDGLEVHHPRRLVIPKIGGASSGDLYARTLIRSLERLHADEPFDAIDAHFAWPDGYAALKAARHFGVPLCVTLHGTDINLMPGYSRIRQRIAEVLLGADRVVAVSQALADLATEVARPPRGIRTIPNGVDTRRFRPLDREDARRELGLPAEGRLLISVGALIPRKGHELLLDAVSRLRASGRRDLRLIIVGEGPSRSALERRIRDLGLSPWVRLQGEVAHDELYRWVSAADLSCLCSSREGWPTVFFESWACGTPVVATAVHGSPEAIHSDTYGVLVDRAEPEAVAQAIDTALDRVWDTDQLVGYAHRNTWEHVVEQSHEVLQSMLGDHVLHPFSPAPEFAVSDDSADLSVARRQ